MTADPIRRKGQRLPWLGALLVGALVVFKLSLTADASGRAVGILLRELGEGLEITEVVADGPAAAAGLEAGDRLLELAGTKAATYEDYERAALFLEKGRPVTFKVERGSDALDVEVVPGYSWFRWETLFPVLVSVLLMIVGLLALFKSTGFLNGRLLFLLSTANAVEFALPLDQVVTPTIDALTWALLFGLAGWQMSFELHFVLLIPERPEWLAKRPWIVPAIYAAGLTSSSLVAAASLLESATGRSFPPLDLEALSSILFDGILPAWALAIVVLLVPRVAAYPQAEGRLQAAILLLGWAPWVLYVLIDLLAAETPGWLEAYFPWTHLAIPVAGLTVVLRESHRQARSLFDLADGIREKTSLADIAALVGESLDRTLHPAWTDVFYLEDPTTRLTLGHSSKGQTRTEAPPPLDALSDVAAREGRPFDYPIPVELPEVERLWLEEKAPRLILPMVGSSNRLVGLIFLGPKKSEEPYTPGDRKILRSLAGHVALVLDNLRLRKDLSQGIRAQRKILARIGDEDLRPVKECPRCRCCFDSSEEVCPKDGERLGLSLPVERTLTSRYRLDRVLGRGGMGAVYEASDLALDRRVAVKVLLEVEDAEAERRFEQEARLSARLNHPHIVAVHDFGRARSGASYLVMELLEGRSLREALDRADRVSPKTLADWFGQLLQGLEAAHAEHVVHRDLKPSNVFLAGRAGEEPRIKILDFGLAKLKEPFTESRTRLTAPGTLLGTVHYMAPEQILGEDVDERTDLFSVGAMTVEAITGRVPFKAASLAATTAAILTRELELDASTPELEELGRVLRKCLAKSPEERYPSAAALSRELVPALAALPPADLPRLTSTCLLG